MKYLLHAYEHEYEATNGIESWKVVEATPESIDHIGIEESLKVMNTFPCVTHNLYEEANYYFKEPLPDIEETYIYQDILLNNIAYDYWPLPDYAPEEIDNLDDFCNKYIVKDNKND